MGELPLLLRRGKVMELLGLTSRQVSKFVEAGKLTVVKYRKEGRAFYKRDEVLELVKEMGE